MDIISAVAFRLAFNLHVLDFSTSCVTVLLAALTLRPLSRWTFLGPGDKQVEDWLDILSLRPRGPSCSWLRLVGKAGPWGASSQDVAPALQARH